MTREKRYIVDCRRIHPEDRCSVAIEGEREDVVKVATRHAVEEHGHTDGPVLRAAIKGVMEEVG